MTYDGIDQQFVTALDKATGKTVWRTDRSTKGLAVTNESDLEERGVIFPKVFRRLTSYFDGGGTGLDRRSAGRAVRD